MIRSNISKSKVVEQPQVEASPDDGTVLAAVLAAALVEYGRHLEQQNGQGGSSSAGGNWRVLACLDRMQGRA